MRKVPTKLGDATRRTRELLEELDAIIKEHPGISRENAWHTLLLLEKPPIERLRRGLVRGNARNALGRGTQ